MGTLLVIAIAMLGLVTGTVFLFLVIIAAVRFHRGRRAVVRPVGTDLPAATLLKPLHGSEPRLRENLESFFRQDYPDFEIVFGARNRQDAALAVVEELQRQYPAVRSIVVLSGEPSSPNAKVCALEKMAAAASGSVFVISDSDVHVTPDYLREVTRPLLEPKIGLVTCLYRGVSIGGPWSRLEALGMSVEMTSGVLVANMMEGMRFALGPTMALRRDVLEMVGGFAVLADYCADDYVLGNLVHEAGYEVVLSHHFIEHVAVAHTMTDSLGHQVRWMKSTRYSRPKGHVGTGLTFAMPFGVLGFIGGLALGRPELAIVLLGWAFLNRLVQALVAGWAIVGDAAAAAYCWLYPVRDLLGFCLWCASFGTPAIVWRGERYRLLAQGKMVPQSAIPGSATPVRSDGSPA